MSIKYISIKADAKLNKLYLSIPDITRAGTWEATRVIKNSVAQAASNISYSGNPSKRIPSLHIDLVKGGANMGSTIYGAYSRDQSTKYIAVYHVSWRKSAKSGLPFTRFGPHVNRGRIRFSRRVKNGIIWIAYSIFFA